jgi:energy-coupling factor transporter ATP-binding protein EcfA2
MKAKLVRFRVTKFRSIQDSGWINASDITCLVGTNESGKTNLLVALSKLKPTSNEPINPVNDFPRSNYHEYKPNGGKVTFISADFEIDEGDLSEVSMDSTKEDGEEGEEGTYPALGRLVRVSRNFDEEYRIEIPNGKIISDWTSLSELSNYGIWAIIPAFVYYSDYGNLNSEIYLPQVVQHIGQLQSRTLTEKQWAKARTLKVLFDFLNLAPMEIQQMGLEQDSQPNKELHIIEAETKKKQERQILMASASSKLTKEFKTWWGQGDYRFDFSVDGSYLRIWVSDGLRPEKIELENRSRGLQWFFSFFIVFLVESKGSHNNCILLLDEPGLTLHPMAQYDLIKFFESLSETNQLLYSTHSPFMVNADRIGDVVAVYVADNGETKVSHDLREGNKDAEKSIYPVHTAIGITVSDTLLLGCTPVLVEGPSDQVYLIAVKNYLSKIGKYSYGRELVFIPTGGVKGVNAVKNIITGVDEQLPFVLLDGDKAGLDMAKSLLDGSYKAEKDRVITADKFSSLKDAEFEDLMPGEMLAKLFSREYRGLKTDDFDDLYDSSKPIVDQMEAFIASNGHSKAQGWKVELAKAFANSLRRQTKAVEETVVVRWEKLFGMLTGNKD